MRCLHPRTTILLGLALVLSAFVAAFLMVLRLVKPSFVLSFLAYGVSVTGLFLGLIGASSLRRGS
jgi:hypothetical protein